MISYSIFKPIFKTTIAQAVYNEVVSNTSSYYHWIGKENTWQDFLSPFIPSSDGDYPGAPQDNFRYELHVRRDILTAKKITSGDVSLVIRRIDWVSDTVYDMYDDAINPTEGYGYGPAYSGAGGLDTANFYVLTTDYNVYKCIDNNYNAKSTYMPIGTTQNIFTTADGYKWKFMYTIPVSLRNRFLSSTWMPVSTALTNQFYSNGTINNINIVNGGYGYNQGTTSAVISGDGYLEANPYTIDSLIIQNPGYGYSTITLTVSPPITNYIEWSAYFNLNTGSYVAYTNTATNRTNFYLVISGTQLGNAGPIHTSGTVNNGTAQLQYVGTTAVANAVITSESVSQVNLIDSGYGYSSAPTITVSQAISGSTNWSRLTTVTLGEILNSNGIYYEVTTAGTTGTVAPIDTTGNIITDGTASIQYIGADAVITPHITKTEAEISLIISAGVDSLYTVSLTNEGAQYVETPNVTISDPPSGTTANAIANVSNGVVTYVGVTLAGNGYLTAPSVTIDRPTYTFNAATAVNNTNHTITYDGHLFNTGDEVEYIDNGGTGVGGLTSTFNYYVIVVDTNTIQLATSALNATNGTYISITAGTGADHKLVIQTPASRATGFASLGTGGNIVGYAILDGGVGYTSANITVVDTSGSGSGAVLTPNLNIGNINTLQANVELLAVPGTIEVIKVVDQGTGYGSATITIKGDGTGATARAVCSGGKVVGIQMTNVGSGYTWTDVIIEGNGTGAVARAIMSPLGGHGSNAIEELYANTLAFYSSFASEVNQGFIINNDYRKCGLIRNLQSQQSNVQGYTGNSGPKFTGSVGSGCVLITGSFDVSKILHDMLLYKVESNGSANYKKYRVVDFNSTQILLSVFNDFSIEVGDTLISDPFDINPVTGIALIPNPTVPITTIAVTAVTNRTINPFSGDFLFVEVMEPFAPSAQQIVTVRTLLTV